jgi:hypothetical protein
MPFHVETTSGLNTWSHPLRGGSSINNGSTGGITTMTDFGFNSLADMMPQPILEKQLSLVKAIHDQTAYVQNFWAGSSKYFNDFNIPALLAIYYMNRVESIRFFSASPLESWKSYLDLWQFNWELSTRGLMGSMQVMSQYGSQEAKNGLQALFNSFNGMSESSNEGEDIFGYIQRHADTMGLVAQGYPQAIRDIEPEYGFHFERGEHIKAAETDRFLLYRIAPTDPTVKVKKNGKPVLIIPPYVLGANILGFLPGENRSYAHCFANQGIPTYIRIMKNIATTPAVQVLTGEDDARDTRYFCEQIQSIHGKPVTLNGYCQGGYSAVCDLLSGELDGVVDALITCVSPMDGTRSKGLAHFLHSLPVRFNDLSYGTKILPNGNPVADGDLMGWVYKLKSIEMETPTVAFIRDLAMLGRSGPKISKTAAALNYWLQYERSDLPLSITEMSFAAYNTPITKDGTLPVKLFGRKLNLKRLQEKGIPWLICYGQADDLVEKETALAPLDYIDAEVSAFPKGHVAIATSWSLPTSACATHTCFGEQNYRGPVCFQMDLDQQSKVSKKPVRKKKGKQPAA